MKKNFLQRICFVVVFFMMLTGCGLFPEEEVFPAAPVIQPYESQEYTQTAVIRGDLVTEKTIWCEYVAVKSENLCFALSGEYIENVYVTQGQLVKAGDLLAELKQDNLKEQIALREYQIKVIELKIKHLKEDQKLEALKQDAKLDAIPEGQVAEREAQQQKADAQKEKYEQQLQALEDSKYIENIHLKELKQALAARRIVAGIDGTVTYVSTVKDGQRSKEGEVFIKISDMTTTAFTVTGDSAAHFPVGSETVIVKGGIEYAAVSVEASVLGMETPGEGEAPIAYLMLKQPDPSLESGDSGTITLVLDSRINTLYVSKDAIKTANGKQFVYVLNEEGLKVMKDVTLGLENEKYIEIISGLAEGDRVIVE